MKKVITLFLSLFVATSIFALDMNFDFGLGLGYGNYQLTQKETVYNSSFEAFQGSWVLDVFFNPVPVGIYLRLDPVSVGPFTRTIDGNTEKLTVPSNSSIGAAVSLGAVYNLDFNDFFSINFAGAITYANISAEIKDSYDNLLSNDYLSGAGVALDIYAKYAYRHFFAIAGCKASVYPNAIVGCKNDTYDYTGKNTGYSFNPYIACGYRFRLIKF